MTKKELKALGLKKCSLCEENFSIDNFFKKESACKACSKERRKSYYTREEFELIMRHIKRERHKEG